MVEIDGECHMVDGRRIRNVMEHNLEGRLVGVRAIRDCGDGGGGGRVHLAVHFLVVGGVAAL